MSTSTQRPGAILIIEDDTDIRETFREVLELEGYKVLTAANGKDAIDRADPAQPVALILLDLMMPVMNGWEFLESRKNSPSLADVPVVVVTAAGARPEKIPQASETIKKPVEIDTLIDAAARYCRR